MGSSRLSEAEQVRIRVRASDNLDGFENAGLVFVADGHNSFRLAAAVRPRTVVCVVCPTGRDPSRRNSRLAVPFPFPRRLVRISFCETDRVALFPDPATDPETMSALAVGSGPRLHIGGVPRRGAAPAPRRLKAYQYRHGLKLSSSGFPPASGRAGRSTTHFALALSGGESRHSTCQPAATAHRHDPLGAVYRRARELGHAALFARFRTARDFAGCDIEELATAHQVDRVLPQQGEEHPRPAAPPRRALRRRGAGHARRAR